MTSSLWCSVEFLLNFLIWCSTVIWPTVPYVINFLTLQSFNSLLTSLHGWHVVEKGWLIPNKLGVFVRATKSVLVKFKNTTTSLYRICFSQILPHQARSFPIWTQSIWCMWLVLVSMYHISKPNYLHRPFTLETAFFSRYLRNINNL